MTYTEEQYNDVLRSTAAEMQALIVGHAESVKKLEATHASALAAKASLHEAEILRIKDEAAVTHKWHEDRYAALTAERDEIAAERDAARAAFEEKSAAHDVLESRIAELTAIPETPDILTQLNAAFKSALPPEAQASFAMPYAIVRVLVQSGEIELARAVISSIDVPPELAEAKAGLLALLLQ